jgi:PhnB protein
MSAYIRPGFRTLTACPTVPDAPAFLEFLKTVFAAEETFQTVGGAGGIHGEVRIGDSTLMLGGGGPGLYWPGPANPMAFHISVPDCDAAYSRALKAGASSLTEPVDQSWGERNANVKDPFGNYWYIGTHKGESYSYPGMPELQPYLHPLKAEPVIDFIKQAFNAEELGRFTTPEGRMEHTTLRIGDATLEMTEATGPYQPMPSMFYLYVPDADASYNRALEAGATSISRPSDQPYGERSGGVTDPFGNRWYLATRTPKK